MKVETVGYTGAKNFDDFEWISATQNITHLFTGFVRKPTNFTKHFGNFAGLPQTGNYNFDLKGRVIDPKKTVDYGWTATDITQEVNLAPAGFQVSSDVLLHSIRLGKTTGDLGVVPSFIYESCHGLSNLTGEIYNFYHAFSPYGTIQSPWGQLYTNTTIFGDFATNNNDPPQIDPNLSKKLAASDYQSAINQVNPSLTSTEYHQLFGINAIPCAHGFGCNTSSPTQITYPYYECPSDKNLSPRFAEAEIRWVPGKLVTDPTREYIQGPTTFTGSVGAKIGGGFYNNNLIPTVFDSQFYLASPDFCNPQSSLLNVYNNFSCPAYIFEKGVSANRGSNGLLPDYVANAVAGFGFGGLGGNGKGGFVDGLGAGLQPINESFWFWNFVYKENAETFPFSSQGIDNGGISVRTKNSSVVNPDGSRTDYTNSVVFGNNPAVEVFKGKIAREDWYWDHRSCGEYPSSLPWSFGGAIFAYPDSFFEVPYYSSLGKFGFYGARFLNGKGTVLGGDINTGTFSCSMESNPLAYTNGGVSGPSSYNNLLKIASNQQLYNNFYVGNKGLMIAFNFETIANSYAYTGDYGWFSYVPEIKKGYKDCYDFFINSFYPGFHGQTSFKNYWISLNKFPSVSDLVNSLNPVSFLDSTQVDQLSGLAKIASKIMTNEVYDTYVSKYNFGSKAPQAIDDIFAKEVIIQNPDTGVSGDSFIRDESFYSGLYSTQLNSIRARALHANLIDNPVDFYPLNQINYSFEDSRDFITGKELNSYFLNPLGSAYKNIPQVGRRYFYGAYASITDSANVSYVKANDIDHFNQKQDESLPYVYGGLFPKNNSLNELFQPVYLSKTFPISGNRFLASNVFDKNNIISIDENSFGTKAAIYFLGYNGVGTFSRKFSCFSPIFTQQPTDVICKLGQAPQLRCSAVDYHTIPEDKIIGRRWPEINYWVDKLKLNGGFYDDDKVYLEDGTETTIGQLSKDKKSECFNGITIPKKELLYPLHYKWGRVGKNDYYQYSLGSMSKVEWANPTGVWSCAEGDKSNCTVIHPLECIPPLTGTTINITPGEATNSVTYIQGAKKDFDDLYYYFCIVSGRFGMRRSERAELLIENKLRFDIAIKNPSPRSISPVLTILAPHPTFENITVPISVSASKSVGPFYGYQPNELAIREEVIADRRTANALGCLPSWQPCCDTPKLRHLGMNGYSAWNVSWSPPAVLDMPVLNSIYGHILHYGGLVPFETQLNQSEGNYLYGSYPLPQISNGSFIGNKRGVSIKLDLGDGITVSHWSVDEVAWATDTSKEGIPFRNGDIVSALYPPSEGALRYSKYPAKQTDQSYGKGHWQFSNNLGLVKKLSYKRARNEANFWADDAFSTFFGDIVGAFGGIIYIANNDGSPGLVASLYQKDIDQLTKDIANSLRSYPNGDAGWQHQSLGRHMAYFIEGFDSFYLLCGNKKKEFVKNWSFVAAGLRVGNAGFQYSFLGQPNSSYLTREPLYGPYAYMWKLNRHNRDRNGNGMPLGMYAYSTDGPYSMMSDIPAIYGMYTFDASKTNSINSNREVINQIKDIRRIIWEEKQNDPIRFEFNSNDDKATIEISPAHGDLDEHGDVIVTPAVTATIDVTKWCGVPNGNNNYTCSGPNPASAGGVLDPNAGPVWFCLYGGLASNLASSPDLSIYNCTQFDLEAGNCFHPCLSLRYDQGLLPGGKKLDFFGKSAGTTQMSLPQPNRISSDAHYNYSLNSQGETVLGPINTPWAKDLVTLLGVTRSDEKFKNLASIDPRFGGGCDHCNYVTPTAWLGSTQNAQGYTNGIQVLINKFLA